MRTRVVGLGAGGHAKGILEILRGNRRFRMAGLLDPSPSLKGRSVLGVAVLGGDERLPGLARSGVRHFFMGVGSTGDSDGRRRLYESALRRGLTPVTAVHPRSVVSPSARIGRGCVLMAGSVVNAGAVLGENVIVNTGAVVEHDCVVGDHAHVAPGAILAGAARVGKGAHVGAGAVVLQGIRVGDEAVVGAGAVVVRNVPPRTVVAGAPARPLKGSRLRARLRRRMP